MGGASNLNPGNRNAPGLLALSRSAMTRGERQRGGAERASKTRVDCTRSEVLTKCRGVFEGLNALLALPRPNLAHDYREQRPEGYSTSGLRLLGPGRTWRGPQPGLRASDGLPLWGSKRRQPCEPASYPHAGRTGGLCRHGAITQCDYGPTFC
jgi:hypothetical protein